MGNTCQKSQTTPSPRGRDRRSADWPEDRTSLTSNGERKTSMSHADLARQVKPYMTNKMSVISEKVGQEESQMRESTSTIGTGVTASQELLQGKLISISEVTL